MKKIAWKLIKNGRFGDGGVTKPRRHPQIFHFWSIFKCFFQFFYPIFWLWPLITFVWPLILYKRVFIHLFFLIKLYIKGIIHAILGTLAFKNDIGFWVNTESKRGISVSGVVSRFVMQLIIFLHLCDQDSISRIILV